MKLLHLIIILSVLSLTAAAQTSLQMLVDTENAFANMAAEKGTRAAFLEFLSDDSIVFNPQRSNGKQVWTARKPSPSLLSWYPIFADISGNGLIGYTTGPWEYRPNGKDDAPAAFGHFMTIWQRRPDGKFRAVLDLGVSHDKTQNVEAKLASVPQRNEQDPKITSNAGDTAVRFFEVIAASGVEKAYKQFAAEDIRLMREGRLPFVGKKAALKAVADIKGDLAISKRMSFFGSDDISYATNTYVIKNKGQVTETGNFVQVWKNRGGRWMIVMDVFVADNK